MEFVASEWSGTDFVASDWTDMALFTSEFLSARLSTLEVCVSDLYCRVGRSYGGESRLLERDQLYGHAGKVSQSKLRRLRAKRLRYRLWSTAQGPDSSCLVHAGIYAPRYYRNFCSDDSEEEDWVEHTDTQVQDAGTYTVPPLQFPAVGAHITSEVRFSSTNLGMNAGAAEPIPHSGSRWFKGGSRELAVRTGVAAVHVESHSQLQDAGVQTVSTARVASKLQVSQVASERDREISLNAECHLASELDCGKKVVSSSPAAREHMGIQEFWDTACAVKARLPHLPEPTRRMPILSSTPHPLAICDGDYSSSQIDVVGSSSKQMGTSSFPVSSDQVVAPNVAARRKAESLVQIWQSGLSFMERAAMLARLPEEGRMALDTVLDDWLRDVGPQDPVIPTILSIQSAIFCLADGADVEETADLIEQDEADELLGHIIAEEEEEP